MYGPSPPAPIIEPREKKFTQYYEQYLPISPPDDSVVACRAWSTEQTLLSTGRATSRVHSPKNNDPRNNSLGRLFGCVIEFSWARWEYPGEPISEWINQRSLAPLHR